MGKKVSSPQAVQLLLDYPFAFAMEFHGTTAKAAEALGVNQSTVVRKLKKSKDTNGGNDRRT